MSEPCTPDALLEAVRGLRVADPDLGFKPLLAKLREQQPELGAATKEVREALKALKAESVAAKAAADPPAADEGGVPSNLTPSLACFGCARLPSDMDDEREKHDACSKCVKHKLLTTYWCGPNCPGCPGAWKQHMGFHKALQQQWDTDDGGARQQKHREMAKEVARRAAETGSEYTKLLAEGLEYESKADWRRAARAYREAIVLTPEKGVAYFNLGNVLRISGHYAEAVQRWLEAKESSSVSSSIRARATASAFGSLRENKECAELARPEWWNDEELKALSARVVEAAPNVQTAVSMRAMVLRGCGAAWVLGPRSAAELEEAATLFELLAETCHAHKAQHARLAVGCRSRAEAM